MNINGSKAEVLGVLKVQVRCDLSAGLGIIPIFYRCITMKKEMSNLYLLKR